MLITIIIIWRIFSDDDFNIQANYIDSANTDCSPLFSHIALCTLEKCTMRCSYHFVKWEIGIQARFSSQAPFSCRQTTLTAQTQIALFPTLHNTCSYPFVQWEIVNSSQILITFFAGKLHRQRKHRLLSIVFAHRVSLDWAKQHWVWTQIWLL